MKKLLLLLLSIMLVGCSSNVNSSPENVINGLMKGLVNKDKELVIQCLETSNNVDELLDNQYTDYKSLKIQEISNDGNTSLYAYTGVLSYGEDLTVPYLNTVKVIEKEELFYVIEESIAPYTDLAIDKLNEIKNSDIYNTYSEKLETFLSQENLENMFKSVEDFKNSEEYAQYYEKLTSLMESQEYKDLMDSVQDLPNSELFQNAQKEINNFMNSEEFKNIQSQLSDYINSEEFKNMTDKLTQYFK